MPDFILTTPVNERPIISSVRVEAGPTHARLAVWSRGGLAGILVVNAEDAGVIAARLLPDGMRVLGREWP